jgi:hypothetical protein
MKILLVAAVLASLFLGTGLGIVTEAFAGYKEAALLSRPQQRAYRACVFEAWIEDWCHRNAARPTATYERVYRECVVVNGGGRFPLAGRTWFNTDDYCWAAAHSIAWHQR